MSIFLANKTNVALYVGVTNNLIRRVYEHKDRSFHGYTTKYGIDRLIYYEIFNDPENAIIREKHLKGSSRAKKNQLVESLNPEWKDLYDNIQ
jgi:putative endonuclease